MSELINQSFLVSPERFSFSDEVDKRHILA